MKKLWAPWRMLYILHADDTAETGCIFCTLPKDDDMAKNYVLYKGSRCFVMLNKFPYNTGHIMVAPYAHKDSIEKLDKQESEELMDLVQKSVEILRKAFSPQGFNIGINIGRVAGAGFDGHVHVHIVPRWNGDTNFMPILADVKVVPEGLDETYRRLRPYFEKLEARK